MLCQNLENEQSKLAENLTRLKKLKSEVTDLKTALASSSEGGILLPEKKEHSNFVAKEVRTDSAKSFDTTSDELNFGQTSFTSMNQDLTLSLIIPTDEVTGNANRSEETSNYVNNEEVVSLTSFLTNKANEVVKKNREDSRPEVLRLIGMGSGDFDQTITDLYPPVETKKFVSCDIKSPDSLKAMETNSRRSLSSENSSGIKSSLIKKKDMVKSPRLDSPMKTEKAGVSTSQVVYDTSKSSNFSDHEIADFELPKSKATFSGCNICTSTDSMIIEERMKEGPSEFSSHHSEQRDEVVDDADSSFIKSLPLTGDPEIDEEIIAFYRAKKSGGIY